ncbi:MAG: radical SAM protein [Thermodesulfobacteriota bacterium]|nr:radical SAM protein [Thermodesulfobacteriota bacterium]
MGLWLALLPGFMVKTRGMKQRKVLLVNPWIHDFAAYDLWAKPLGLLYLGAILRKNNCRVSFIDCLGSTTNQDQRPSPGHKKSGQGQFLRQVIEKPSVFGDVPRKYARYGITPEAFSQRLSEEPRPDVILVTSMMTYWYPGVIETIASLKGVFQGVPVCLGGVYATLCPDHAKEFSGADHIITGEAEDKIVEYLCDMWKISPVFMPNPEDLDSFPYPCFDLIDKLRYVCIQTSRGCPFRCDYCASHLLSRGLRRRSPQGVAQEIAFWHTRYRVRDFAFYDDALLVQPEQMICPLLKEIIHMDYGLRFHCPNGLHCRHLSSQVASLMKKAGFLTIRLGLETSEPERQSSSGAKVTNREFEHAMRNLHAAGYTKKDIGVYILYGLPGQDADEIRNAIDFIRDNGASPMIAKYSPIPGTDLWEQAAASSRYPIKDDPIFHNNTLLTCQSAGLDHAMYLSLRQYAAQDRPGLPCPV